MRHLTTPIWSCPESPLFPLILLIGVCLFIGAILYGILVSPSSKKIQRGVDIATFTAFLVGIGLALAGGVGLSVSTSAGSAQHRDDIAAWLHNEYDATVNPGALHADRDTPNLIQTTATIDGRVRVIKLMPTPDGHVAVFGTDDKPLEKRR